MEGPRFGGGWDGESEMLEIDIGIGVLEVEVSGDGGVFESQGDLDQSGDSGG